MRGVMWPAVSALPVHRFPVFFRTVS